MFKYSKLIVIEKKKKQLKLLNKSYCNGKIFLEHSI